MSSPESGPVSRSWDDEYRRGRYRGEPPIPFVGRIVDILRDRPETMRGKGLYVGCGNGRNYVALVDAGLNLIGLDVSKEAIAQLRAGHPHLAPDLVSGGLSRVRFGVAVRLYRRHPGLPARNGRYGSIDVRVICEAAEARWTALRSRQLGLH